MNRVFVLSMLVPTGYNIRVSANLHSSALCMGQKVFILLLLD